MTVPNEFVWGAATAAFQIEGATTADGRGESIWDRFAATDGQGRPRRHRRPGLRALLPLAGRPRPDALARARGLPLLDRLAPDPARRPRAGQPARARLLPRARRGHARARDRAAGDALPLGSAAGAPGRGRLGIARRRRALRRVRRDRLRRASATSSRLDHAQRAVGDVVPRLRATGSRRPAIRDWPTALRAAHHSLLAHGTAVRGVPRGRRTSGRIGITLDLTVAIPAGTDAEDRAAAAGSTATTTAGSSTRSSAASYPEDMVALLRAAVRAARRDPARRPGDDRAADRLPRRQLLPAEPRRAAADDGSVLGRRARSAAGRRADRDGLADRARRR